LSSDWLPPREEWLPLAGSVASSAAVLAMGFAIATMWAGTSIQATGCVTSVGVTGACKMLPTFERATQYALFVVFVGFVAAFGAEYHQQGVSE